MQRLFDVFANHMSVPATEDGLLEGFRKFDRDGNGVISAGELKNIMTSCGALTEEEADQLIREEDLDGDGFINYREFVRVLKLK